MLIKVPIERLIEIHSTEATAVVLDDQGGLESFTEIVNDG